MRTKFKGCVEFGVVGFVLGIVFTLFMIITLVPSPREFLQKEAVKAGHAEYYLDEDYQRQWRWLPVPEKENALPEVPPAETK